MESSELSAIAKDPKVKVMTKNNAKEEDNIQGKDQIDLTPMNSQHKKNSWVMDNVGGFFIPKQKVSELSIKKQEQLLIRDLIYALSGVPSTYIHPDISSKDAENLPVDYISRVTFKIDESFSGSFRALAREVLPLIGYYINVQSFVEDAIMTTGSGRTLGNVLHTRIEQYLEVLSSLETQYQAKKLNLQQLVEKMRPWITKMKVFAGLATQARRTQLTSTELLNLLHEHLQQFGLEDLKTMLTDVSLYYMKTVQLWTQKGVLYDVRGEFFIQDTCTSDIGSTLQLPKQCRFSYWAGRYELDLNRLPRILQNAHEQIFLAGKYLNILRQCNAEMRLIQFSLTYVPDNSDHLETIQRSYELPAGKLLSILKEDLQLKQHLNIIQEYLLLTNKTFVKSILSESSEELRGDAKNVKKWKLQNILMDSLQSVSDRFKSMLIFRKMPSNVCTQLERVESGLDPQKVKIKDLLNEDENTSLEPLLSGFEAFALCYEPKWPVTLVLQEGSLVLLQILHRVILLLVHVQHQLSSRYEDLSRGKPRAAALCRRLTQCFQNLEQYMLDDVVKSKWKHLLLVLNNAKVVDEVIKEFQATVEHCLRFCLLSMDSVFVRAIFIQVQSCHAFIELTQSEVMDLTVSEYESEFDNFLSTLTKLLSDLSEPKKNEITPYMRLSKRLKSLDERTTDNDLG